MRCPASLGGTVLPRGRQARVPPEPRVASSSVPGFPLAIETLQPASSPSTHGELGWVIVPKRSARGRGQATRRSQLSLAAGSRDPPPRVSSEPLSPHPQETWEAWLQAPQSLLTSGYLSPLHVCPPGQGLEGRAGGRWQGRGTEPGRRQAGG